MATRTWRATINNNWNLAGNWLELAVPTNADDVVFDAASPNCDIDINNPACLTLDCTGFTNTLAAIVAGSTFTVAGLVFKLAAGMTFTHNSQLTVNFTAAAGVIVLTAAGKSLWDLNKSVAGSTLQQADVLVVDRDLLFNAGTYQTNNQNLQVTRDLSFAAGLAVDSFQAGSSTIQVGRSLLLAVSGVMTNAAGYGTSSFQFVGTGGIVGTPAALRNISFFNLYVAAPTKTFTLNVAGASNCYVYGQMTSGSGIFAWTAGLLSLRGVGANPLVPDPACTWQVPLQHIYTLAADVVINIYPCVWQANQTWSSNAADQNINYQLTANVSIAGNVTFESGAVGVGKSRAVNLNGFNLSITGNLALGSAGYSRGLTLNVGPNVLNISGNLTTRGADPNAMFSGVGTITGPTGQLNIGGSFTHSNINILRQNFLLSGATLITVGGSWNQGTVLLFDSQFIASIVRFYSAGAITITAPTTERWPTVEFTGGGTCTLYLGFNCWNLYIVAGVITAAGLLIVRNNLTNNGTLSFGAELDVGSTFVNTGVLVLAGSNIVATGRLVSVTGVNPADLTMGPGCQRLQLLTAMTITTLTIQDRRSPAVLMFLAGGLYAIGTLNSQVDWPEAPVQLVSSVAATQYRLAAAAVTSIKHLWFRDCNWLGAALTGDLTNKNLFGNSGLLVLNSDGQLRFITDDPGLGTLASEELGDLQYCWMVDTSVLGLNAKLAAFAAGANNWHRRTLLPFAVLDNLSLGVTYYVAMALRDERDRRITPAADDNASGTCTPTRGGNVIVTTAYAT